MKVVNILPAAAIALIVALVVLSGAPAAPPSRLTFEENAGKLGLGGIAALSVAVTLVSVAFQPFEMSAIRLLEGYWPVWRHLGTAQQTAVWLQKRKRDTLRYQDGIPTPPNLLRNASTVQASQWPDRDTDILPMTLGNRLRAMERRAASGYGMDAVVSFPRLYLTLPASALAALNELRNQLDASVRFCILFAVGSAVTLALLAGYGWWLLLPAGLLLFSLASYRAAVVAAVNYGNLVGAAFSVFHLRILDETGVSRPKDTVALRAAHGALENLLTGSDDDNVTYVETEK